MAQNTLRQTNSRIFRSTISSEQIDEIVLFLHGSANLRQLKVDEKSLGGRCQHWLRPVWS